jgi:HD superfamily phosphohydrolase
MIIGADLSPEKRFLGEIISGPYDVDKLEYLYRDGYHAGLNIAYDIERYFYRITVANTSGKSGVPNEYRLVMELTGVTAVEQLIFSKMMLFSYIYHHQKVRAADCLVRDIVSQLCDRDDLAIKIRHPVDFLYYTDYDILSCFFGNDDEFSNLVLKLQNRNLWKRCFVISRDYLIGFKTDERVRQNYKRFCTDIREVLKKQGDIRIKILEKINKRTGKTYSLADIYIDLPEIPTIEEAATAPVKLPNNDIEAMSEYFELEGWQKVYEIKKLRGHFFVKSELVNIANEIIREFLREEYQLIFSPLASQMAKVQI